LGALTPAAMRLDDAWSAYVERRVVVEVENGAAIGRVPLDLGDYLTRKETRRMDRLAVFSVVAAKPALADAGLEIAEGNRAGAGAPTPPAPGPPSGVALSEAGIAMHLERLSAARRRGAAIYGEVLGSGITCDAARGGRLDAEGTGLERAIQLALERAGVKADD